MAYRLLEIRSVLPRLASYTPTGRRHVARLWLIAAVVLAALGTAGLLFISDHADCAGCERHPFADDTSGVLVALLLVVVSFEAFKLPRRPYTWSLGVAAAACVIGVYLRIDASLAHHEPQVLSAAAQMYLVVSAGLAVTGVVLAAVDPILHVLERRARARATNLPEARVVTRD
jgi:hypothetical protein